MFFDADIVGGRLPQGTLCLTYDDGPGRTEGPLPAPGPRTEELGEFLHSLGVPATFFAVGRFAGPHGAILARLRSLGHLVGNHTYDHPSLPGFVKDGGDAFSQLARTDDLISSHADGSVRYFRAPYGDWHLRSQTLSNVADVLNQSLLARAYVGPIGWDIDAGDVGFWRDDRSAWDCAEAYLAEIQRIGRGIVLMHDSTADVEVIRHRNRALELARLLVPRLRDLGFRFVRLDSVPQVASAVNVSFQLMLRTRDEELVCSPAIGSEVVIVSSHTPVPEAFLGIVELSENRWAIRGGNGLYLSIHSDGEVVADAPAPGERETFTIEPLGDRSISLRSGNETYLIRTDGCPPRLVAGPRARGEHEIFRLSDPYQGDRSPCLYARP